MPYKTRYIYYIHTQFVKLVTHSNQNQGVNAKMTVISSYIGKTLINISEFVFNG